MVLSTCTRKAQATWCLVRPVIGQLLTQNWEHNQAHTTLACASGKQIKPRLIIDSKLIVKWDKTTHT
jgi:hypothetical protein